MNFIGLEIRQVFRTKRAPQQSKHGKEWKSVSAATTRVRMSSVSAATTRVRMSSPEDVPCRLTRDRPNTGQKKLRMLFFCEGPRRKCYGHTSDLRLIVQPCDEYDQSFFFVFPCGMKLTGENRSTRGKTCPSATLSTKNPTRT